ncbi:MAG TPA: hypothetical protein VNO31_18885, partial [Umezawaea sp.]|nr:hypothetical protein [Umezawaea sp.]
GTHVLAFTQSISRTRWMFSKLAVALLPALVVLVALQSLVTWWLSAAGKLGPGISGPFYALNFGIEHVSPVAYALFAFALGTFIGVVSRRTLVAMTAALTGFVVLRFALFGLMGRLVPAEHLVVEPGSDQSEAQRGLVIETGWVDHAGRQLTNDAAYALIRGCQPTPSTSEQYARCWDQVGLAKQFSDYVPVGQAWQVHLAEASIFGVLAVVLLVGTGWVLRRQS